MEEDIFKEIEAEEQAEQKKKTQNLISAVILLLGMFLGSLFVDTAQLFKKSGYSVKNLNKSDIFEASGKTWVAYTESAVGMQVISDETCEKCDVSEVLVWLRRIVPTISTEKIDFKSDEGRDLIDRFGIKTLPAFIFDDSVMKTDFYTQAKILFDQKENKLS